MNNSGKRMEGDFRRGSKTSSSIMAGVLTDDQIRQFMETSFYLPIDVLKHPDWEVRPIFVITGEDFKKLGYHLTSHCLEDYRLLKAAQFVAVSTRVSRKDRRLIYHVAKIWYGSTDAVAKNGEVA